MHYNIYDVFYTQFSHQHFGHYCDHLQDDVITRIQEYKGTHFYLCIHAVITSP